MPNLDPSTKRFLALIVGSLVTALNRKLGLDLPENEVLALVSLIATYILTSKGGEVLIARAEAKGVDAAAEVLTLDQANEIIAKAIASIAPAPADTAAGAVLVKK